LAPGANTALGFPWMKRFLLACVLAGTACSGTPTPPPGLDLDATVYPARGDAAAFQACFAPSGGFLPDLKACTTDTDCTRESPPFCCGFSAVVGASLASVSAIAACFAAWPGCPPQLNDCAIVPGASAEDGRFSDAGIVVVHCVGPDGGGPLPSDAGDAGAPTQGQCMTSVP
jgi:hypothetical protein